ncbi:MAG: DUF3820 family protein [Microcystis sp. M179S2]|jgi:hypothetical protein|uniref:DUF3820 family protein n=1 Tax=Microcystis sp. M179S2 TaxID=2771160 RepID=UPI00258C6075|nr:DUF3820 family protein [Microcystis sp. M179S2]MCA2699475.1 DUF3820 family protein [Microcystis sp. M179S2]
MTAVTTTITNLSFYNGRFTPDFIQKEIDSRLGTRNHDKNQRITFGKYAGLKYGEVPEYYLDWMVFKQVKPLAALQEIQRQMLGGETS